MDFQYRLQENQVQLKKLRIDRIIVLFIGYAPADDPEIAVAVRIVNGYEAGNAVECGKNIFEYYFGIE